VAPVMKPWRFAIFGSKKIRSFDWAMKIASVIPEFLQLIVVCAIYTYYRRMSSRKFYNGVLSDRKTESRFVISPFALTAASTLMSGAAKVARTEHFVSC
jgi:hypothetical protein